MHLEGFKGTAWRGWPGETQGSDTGIRCEELYGGCRWREQGDVLISLANSALLGWGVAGRLGCPGPYFRDCCCCWWGAGRGSCAGFVSGCLTVPCCVIVHVLCVGKVSSPSWCLDLPMGASTCASVRLEWEKPHGSGRALRLTSLKKLSGWFSSIFLQNMAKRRVILCNKFLII